jgi:hypothetical protein
MESAVQLVSVHDDLVKLSLRLGSQKSSLHDDLRDTVEGCRVSLDYALGVINSCLEFAGKDLDGEGAGTVDHSHDWLVTTLAPDMTGEKEAAIAAQTSPAVAPVWSSADVDRLVRLRRLLVHTVDTIMEDQFLSTDLDEPLQIIDLLIARAKSAPPSRIGFAPDAMPVLARLDVALDVYFRCDYGRADEAVEALHTIGGVVRDARQWLSQLLDEGLATIQLNAGVPASFHLISGWWRRDSFIGEVEKVMNAMAFNDWERSVVRQVLLMVCDMRETRGGGGANG